MGQSQDIADLVAGQTLATAFLSTIAEHGDALALREQVDGGWRELTFAQYADAVAAAAAGLRDAGVAPGDRVVLLMRNVVDFHIIDTAAVFCGATPISIYNSSSADQIAYLAGHSGATVAVVEHDEYAARFKAAADRLPQLRRVLNLADPADRSALLDHDQRADLEAGAQLVTPESLATVIYTSGTTGDPKGVMVTHSMVLWTAESLRRGFGDDVDLQGKRLVSYLPMAHVAERMVSHYSGIVLGYSVACCPDPALLAPTLAAARPNILFGVPRVWEKIHAGVMAALAADPDKAEKFAEGVAAATPIALARNWGTSTAEQDATWDFLQDVAFRPVRELVGLDQVEFAISGAAPINRELLEWYNAIGVPMSEVYGLSETCGPMTWTPWKIKPGTVGPAISGVEIKLGDDGEILCRGGNVFPGYLNDPDKTAEALEPDGWFHSGDIGEIDEDGYVKVVDRKKELIITAGGKNISPANLEAALKAIPLVGQAFAVGDDKPFVAALVVLDPEVAPVWATNQGIEFTDLADLAQHPQVVAVIEEHLPLVMEGFNQAEKVKKVKVLGEEWLPDSDVLTPTSKLKRRGIRARYEAEIASLYA